MSRSRKGRRQLLHLQAGLSERDQAILASVAQLRLVSARQLERLHFTVPQQHATALSAARSCRRSLERLVRERALLRLERRIGGLRAGSASYIYAIGPVGERILGSSGPRRRFREPSTVFVTHTLAVSDLVVRLYEAKRQGELRLLAVETEPDCWRQASHLGGRMLIKPDLSVDLTAGGYEFRWFVEVDLGTEHTPAVLRKCQTYDAYYRSGVEQQRHGVFPRVVWLVPDERRAISVRRAIGQSMNLTDGLFLVALSDGAIDVLAGRAS